MLNTDLHGGMVDRKMTYNQFESNLRNTDATIGNLECSELQYHPNNSLSANLRKSDSKCCHLTPINASFTDFTVKYADYFANVLADRGTLKELYNGIKSKPIIINAQPAEPPKPVSSNSS